MTDIQHLTVQIASAGEVGLIQGIVPGSINEWNFAQALDNLRLEYTYQYPLGMMGSRGSQRIDFVVYTPPAPQACYIQGSYWHSTRTQDEDRLKHAIAEHYFGKGNVVDFSEEETADEETAIASIRSKIL